MYGCLAAIDGHQGPPIDWMQRPGVGNAQRQEIVKFMTISSRTPERTPNHCPVCDSDIRIEPSLSSDDAPCPKCGTLLWFIDGPSGVRFYKSESIAPIQESIQGIICETIGLDKEQIRSSSAFVEDLQADSLDTVELVMALEETFDLSVSENDVRQMKTVGDVVSYVIRNSP